MPRLIVTGLETALGANLALRLAESGPVLGLSERRTCLSNTLDTASWQADQPASIERHLREFTPDWVLHVGPLSACSWNPAPCPTDAQRESQRVVALANLCAACGCRLAVLSSDVVFTGPRLFHEETSVPGGTSAWAQQVLRMECGLVNSGALVVRTHAYGWGGAEPVGFAQQAAEALLAGVLPRVDGCRHATPILATDLADLLVRCFEHRLTGLYHLSGAERTSPFRFLAELAMALGVDLPKDLSTTSPAAGGDETSLSSKRARRILGAATPMLRPGLERFAAQAHNGWRQSLQSGQHPARIEVAA